MAALFKWKEVSKLIHEEIDKEISGKSVNIAVRMLKPELDQFMRGLNKAVQAPAKTAGKAVVNKIHPTAGRQSIKTLIKQGQGVSSIPLADEGLRDFQKIAKNMGWILQLSETERKVLRSIRFSLRQKIQTRLQEFCRIIQQSRSRRHL